MSRLAQSALHVARFTLEARTALSIGTGGPDGVYDHPIVRDANGLPMIPGTSLAGVLRHLWTESRSQVAADTLFGYQRRGLGAASRLEVAAGALQDSRGQPVTGLLIDSAGLQRLRADPLLKAALATRDDPLFRDRVRISHRGTAAKTGKYDRGLLAAGHRFSGELRLWSTVANDPDWTALLALLDDPRLRLGGATRAGMGALRLVSLHTGVFDLRDAQGIAAFRRLGPGIGDTAGLTATVPVAQPQSSLHRLEICLTPRDFWRIGQGHGPFRDDPDGREPDLVPKLEPIVTWANGLGEIKPRLALVPGSAVKGALAHRTAFHWNLLNGYFADELTPAAMQEWDKSEHCEGVRAIFGHAKSRDQDREETGQAGHVLIDDSHVTLTPNDVQAMIHNSLDRFTGGVRDRMLFTEELVFRRPIPLTMTLLPGLDQADETARRALARAIRDLCEGRLALGGGATKGHGAFTGEPDDATRAWLKEQGEVWT